jgi:hypothetical protein
VSFTAEAAGEEVKTGETPLVAGAEYGEDVMLGGEFVAAEFREEEVEALPPQPGVKTARRRLKTKRMTADL